VVANTMAMSVRERLGEYAVFKTLGFGGSYLVLMIVGESLLISGLGTLSGILCTYPAADVFTRNLGEFFPIFHLSTGTIRLQVAAGISVGLVAAIFPSWRAATIPIAEGMGRMG